MRKLYEYQLREHLKPLHSKRLAEIDTDDIRLVIRTMKAKTTTTGKPLSGNTIRNALVPLNALLNTAKARKLIASNPVQELEARDHPPLRQRKKRKLKPAEAAALLRAAGLYKPILALGLHAGLRISEVLALTWGDIEFGDHKTDGKIHVRFGLEKEGRAKKLQRVSLKGRDGEEKERDVEMSQTLARILRGHRAAVMRRQGVDRIPPADELIFMTSNATPYLQRNIQRAFDLAVKKGELTGEPKLTFHQLRHTFASAAIAAGAEIGYVADHLGHTNPNITLRTYRKEFREAREAGSITAAMDRIFGEAVNA